MFEKFLFPAAAVFFLAGCATTAQYTSGQRYLKKYEQPVYQTNMAIDQEVRDIAAIEPNLSFPARIGLARIESGRLTSVPADEARHWQDLTSSFDQNYGDFVPVSPLIAAMVSGKGAPASGRVQNSAAHIVEHIRKGSARQHLDYVLIYEVDTDGDAQSNALRLADLSILGLYVLPSRDVKIEASASALLLDVRNGYPYGNATTFADKSSLSTFAGRNRKKDKLSSQARLLAVDNLTDEVGIFIAELGELAARE